MTLDPGARQRIAERLARLYGDAADHWLERLVECVERAGPVAPRRRGWDQRDVVLISYGDQVRRAGAAPLAALGQWLRDEHEAEPVAALLQSLREHPVNASRPYLKAARQLGEKIAGQFRIPKAIADEFDGLAPVVLEKGQKLYVATTDFSPCAHGWVNIHPDNKTFAVVNENSAVPLDLVIAKPPVNAKYAQHLIPPKGSADMTTDWFYRGLQILRKPLLEGLFKG